MSCGIQQHKNVVYIFNFVLAVCGIISLGTGVMLRAKSSVGTAASTTMAGNVLIAIGLIVFAFSIFGLLAIRRNNCYVFITYACLLTLLMLAQIGVGATVLVQSLNGGSLQSNIKNTYTPIFNSYWTNPSIEMSIDDIQASHRCCGIEGAEDFARLGRVVPGSCCGRLSFDTCTIYDIYPKGCLIELQRLVLWSGSICGWILFGIAVFELVDIVLVFVLARAMRNAQRGGYMY